MSQPHIVVQGAGLVGGFLGGALAAGGARVTLLGRARFVEPLAKGLALSDLNGLQVRVGPERFRTATHPVCLAEADVVLVCVKSHATAAAAAELARFTRPGTVAVSFQNGVRNPELLAAFAPHCQVVAGMVPFNVMQPAPTHWHRGTEGALHISPHPYAEALRPYLIAANVGLEVHPYMPAVLWTKVLMNLNNAINALSGVPLRAQLSDRHHRVVLAACIVEGLAAVRASGIEPARLGNLHPDELPRILRLPTLLYSFLAMRRLRIDEHARSSMAEDLQQRRPTEIDELNGAVVRAGAERGMPTPVNQRIIELIRAAEAGDPRRYTGAQLRHYTGL
jgi:2-dehydropantoate 2-reductase